jgi:serine/threonine protein kinase
LRAFSHQSQMMSSWKFPTATTTTANNNNKNQRQTGEIATRTKNNTDSSMANTTNEQLKDLPASTLIHRRFRLQNKLGNGAFGVIYSAQDISTGELVAVKLEPTSAMKQTLKMEIMILKRLQTDTTFFCKFYSSGRCEIPHSVHYLAMELLGESIGQIRKRCQTFSHSTTALLLMQMLQAIRQLHEAGYIHRDIKPSNFALRLSFRPVSGKALDFEIPGFDSRFRICCIDFGLCRRFASDDGIRKVRLFSLIL